MKPKDKDIEAALLAVIEIAMTQTGKIKSADALRATAERIETKVHEFTCELYKTPSGTPVLKVSGEGEGNSVSLSGYKLLQKATSLDGKTNASHGSAAPTIGGQTGKADSAERNRSVGLMRRKSG